MNRIAIQPGDRVRRGYKIGTARSYPHSCAPGFPLRVTVEWDDHIDEFRQNCNAHPERDHVKVECLKVVKQPCIGAVCPGLGGPPDSCYDWESKAKQYRDAIFKSICQ